MRKLKKTLIILAVILVAGGGGFFGWKYYSSKNVAPVKVYPFNYVGMTEYWGDSRESYGPVTTDKIQTIYLTDTQTVSEILVKEGQEVKKGDLLMSFDTTLSQLELERKELEIQKDQMDLEDAQKELQRISWMVPMGTPPTEPETEPTEPDYGRRLEGEYELFREGHDGSSENSAFICWIPMGKVISTEFLQQTIGDLTDIPTEPPTEAPTEDPSSPPTEAPTEAPGNPPTENPSEPSVEPTAAPTQPVFGPVRVTFLRFPDYLTLAVYSAEQDTSVVIDPEPDGTYLLLPGKYTYVASAEGYETTRRDFTVPEQTGSPFQVEIVLNQNPTQPPVTEEPVTEAPTEAPTEVPVTEAASEVPVLKLTGAENLISFTAFLSEGDVNPTQAPTEVPTEAPTQAPTENPGEPTNPAQPTEPEKKCTPYNVIFKITRDNLLKADVLVWIGVHVNADGSFSFFDASQMEDFSIPVEPTEPTEAEPYVDYIGSGYTYSQIQQMKKEQEQKIKDLEITLKLAESELKIMQKELSDGHIYAEQDGKVISVLTEEDAKLNSQPIIKVSGGGGYYIDASVSELERSSMKVGQEVTINDWNSGMTYTGSIVSIGDIPSSSNSYNGNNNPNASSYPFRVFVDENADLQAGNYVSVTYSSAEQIGIYLEKPFLRTEDGVSYVYVRGEDGLLERRTVTVGKNVNGYYVAIQDGLTEDDMVAFPYGKNVKPGVPTEEGDYSDMYA